MAFFVSLCVPFVVKNEKIPSPASLRFPVTYKKGHGLGPNRDLKLFLDL